MQIIGPPTATWETVRTMLLRQPSIAPLFVNEIAPALWDAGLENVVDPLGMVAQSAKETDWGRFPGKVKAGFYNTAGIKVRNQGLYPESAGDLPLAHAQFASWWIGARAHAQHLRAYAGCAVPERDVVDPRYWLVFGKHRLGSFMDLGGPGRWAPSPSYGTELVQIARKLTEVSL